MREVLALINGRLPNVVRTPWLRCWDWELVDNEKWLDSFELGFGHTPARARKSACELATLGMAVVYPRRTDTAQFRTHLDSSPPVYCCFVEPNRSQCAEAETSSVAPRQHIRHNDSSGLLFLPHNEIDGGTLLVDIGWFSKYMNTQSLHSPSSAMQKRYWYRPYESGGSDTHYTA